MGGHLGVRIVSICLAGIALLGLAGCGIGAGAGQDVAATVNGRAIARATYRQALNVERQRQAAQTGFDACATRGMGVLCSQWKRQALDTLIQNELIREYARRQGITVTNAESTRYWRTVYRRNFGSKRVLRTFLMRNGETYAYLRASLDADLLRSKVLYPITRSMSPYAPAVALGLVSVRTRKALKLARRLIRQGLPFQGVIADMIGQRTACLPNGCVELGWVPYSFLPPGVDAVKTASIGSVVGPIVYQQAFDLYKVWNRTPRYRMTPQQQYTRRVQLLNQWLRRQERKARIKRYVAA